GRPRPFHRTDRCIANQKEDMTKHTEIVSRLSRGVALRLLPCLAAAATALLPAKADIAAPGASNPAAATATARITAPEAARAPDALQAAALPAGVEAGPSIEGVSEYRLENGLRIL